MKVDKSFCSLKGTDITIEVECTSYNNGTIEKKYIHPISKQSVWNINDIFSGSTLLQNASQYQELVDKINNDDELISKITNGQKNIVY
jgi:hypothetical protein